MFKIIDNILEQNDILDNTNLINQLLGSSADISGNFVSSEQLVYEADLLINSVDEVIQLLKESQEYDG